jgi:hypothetical protein
MTGKYAVVGARDECEPGSHERVLRNLLGIVDPEEMEAAESSALVDAMEVLVSELPTDYRFTADDVRMLHRSGAGQGAYFGAIRAAWSKGDYSPLATLFEEVIQRSLEVSS